MPDRKFGGIQRRIIDEALGTGAADEMPGEALGKRKSRIVEDGGFGRRGGGKAKQIMEEATHGEEKRSERRRKNV